VPHHSKLSSDLRRGERSAATEKNPPPVLLKLSWPVPA